MMFSNFLPPSISEAFTHAALSLHRPKGRVIVFCGAGLSAPSGLSVYRGGCGSWTLHPDAYAAMDMRNWPGSRQKALHHLAQWRQQALAAEPNLAHRRIAAWKRAWPRHVDIVTQNVDGLFQKAGLSDSDVLEVHGSLHRMRCLDCSLQWPLSEPDIGASPCPRCASTNTKPSVIFFHEPAPLYSRMDQICDPDIRMSGDTFLAIGTSWQVIDPSRLMHTRGRVLGQQIGIDSREQPDMDSWLHDQFSRGAIDGVFWAERKIFQQWRMA